MIRAAVEVVGLLQALERWRNKYAFEQVPMQDLHCPASTWFDAQTRIEVVQVEMDTGHMRISWKLVGCWPQSVYLTRVLE